MIIFDDNCHHEKEEEEETIHCIRRVNYVCVHLLLHPSHRLLYQEAPAPAAQLWRHVTTIVVVEAESRKERRILLRDIRKTRLEIWPFSRKLYYNFAPPHTPLPLLKDEEEKKRKRKRCRDIRKNRLGIWPFSREFYNFEPPHTPLPLLKAEEEEKKKRKRCTGETWHTLVGF